MKSRLSTVRTFVAAGLLLALLHGSASAQDVYKSRAELFKAAAANKAANAAIIEATANFSKAQAEIAKIQQEIREKAVQNDLLESKVFYEKRAHYHAYRDARRAESRSAQEYTERARRLARARPVSYQSGGKPGLLRWPTLLKNARYAALRRRIDSLLKSRTQEDSGTGSQNCVDTMTYVDELRAELRSNIRQYKPGDYLAARKFLDNVASEAQEPFLSMEETLDKIAGR